ncbi:MAG: hypothetical protein ABIP48_20380 [Planctomycetota bacterium]
MDRFIQLFPLRIVVAVVASVLLASAPGRLTAQEGPEPLQERIDRLIEELGDAKYAVRERAQEELAELGYEAYDALQAATTHEDLEIATRAKYLLLLIPAQWSVENEPEEVRRYLAYYHQSPSPEMRSEVLSRLARLPGGVGVPALCRLVRFETSTLWSKHAAVALFNQEPLDQTGRDRWVKTLQEHLGRSGRPAARWLHAYLAFQEAPKATLAEWTKLAEEEEQVFKQSPDQSSPRIVATLWYHLAIAQADQGEAEPAEKSAERARQFSPSRSANRLDARLDTAVALGRRGRFPWAELEYRQVIDGGPNALKVRAAQGLAEMQHDQGNDLGSAEALADLLKIDDQELTQILAPFEQTIGGVRARMSFFHACHWAGKGDRARHRKFLDEAVQHDPAELDVLIARHQLPDTDPEYQRQTLAMIEKAAAGLRQQIGEFPDQPIFYNQFAWLVGNTAGDRDEALRFAQKAVELRPESGAYLDTLAHVYFGRGEVEKAVETQTKAAEFEPHSGLIAKKLEVFRNALNGNKSAPGNTP